MPTAIMVSASTVTAPTRKYFGSCARKLSDLICFAVLPATGVKYVPSDRAPQAVIWCCPAKRLLPECKRLRCCSPAEKFALLTVRPRPTKRLRIAFRQDHEA